MDVRGRSLPLRLESEAKIRAANKLSLVTELWFRSSNSKNVNSNLLSKTRTIYLISVKNQMNGKYFYRSSWAKEFGEGALLKFSHSHWTDCTIRRQILLYLKMKKDLRYVIFHSRQPHSIEAKRWPTSVPHPQIIGCLMPEPAIRYRRLIWFYLNRIILTNMRISFQNCLVDF